MAEKTVPARAEQETSTPPATREETRYLVPPVDIYETEHGLVVVADLPGVEKDNLKLRAENGILTIEAKPSFDVPGSPTYDEFNLLNYYRQFELPDRVDQDKISAELKNGVLIIQLPKAEKAKPKQIGVKIA
jgi:HSP20 family molecular chaperone IbpA